MDLGEALAFVDNHGREMLASGGSDLTAVAVSSKDGGPITEADDYTVTAYVERKLTAEQMDRANVKPFLQVFAQAIGGGHPRKLDIDVVESGSPFRPLTRLSVPIAHRGMCGGPFPMIDARKMFRSLRCGIGITNPFDEYPNKLGVGTLGFFVIDGEGEIHLVSNNHVIAKSSDQLTVRSVLGQSVVQPGTLDLTEIELAMLSSASDLESILKIAEVSGIVPLRFSNANMIPVNRADAAMARLVGPATRKLGDLGRMTFGGGIIGMKSYQADINKPNRVLGDARVHKVGRTTGYTEGEVVGLAGAASIDYGNGNIAYFAGQLIIRPTADNVGLFSTAGDSGSAVLDAQNRLIGLLFSGSNYQTLVNPIDDVLRELTATLPSVNNPPSLSIVMA